MKRAWYHKGRVYKRLANFTIILFSLFFAGGVLILFTANDNSVDQVLGERVEVRQPSIKGTATVSDNFYGFWECGVDVYDCSDFNFAEAQAIFEFCGGVGNDVHNFDLDGDSIACFP